MIFIALSLAKSTSRKLTARKVFLVQPCAQEVRPVSTLTKSRLSTSPTPSIQLFPTRTVRTQAYQPRKPSSDRSRAMSTKSEIAKVVDSNKVSDSQSRRDRVFTPKSASVLSGRLFLICCRRDRL
jgi:hypothetical protein